MAKPFVRETRSNSYGSPYWAFLADPELVVRLAASDLQSAFRRVTLDPVRGLVVLMSPARAHERESELAGDVIKAIASILDVPLVSLRSVRWRRPSDPPNTGPEPDCCLYVGARARAYLAAERSGGADAERFVLHEPPDIVVEVGVTHLDDEKIAGYRERRVAEYWQVDRQPRPPPRTFKLCRFFRSRRGSRFPRCSPRSPRNSSRMPSRRRARSTAATRCWNACATRRTATGGFRVGSV